MSKTSSADRFRKSIQEAGPNIGTGPSSARGLRLVAAVIGGLILLWLVIRVSLANALLAANPAAAASLAPKHPDAMIRLTNAAQVFGATAPAHGGATDLLSSAPLAEQPFLLAARQAVEDGDRERAGLLLDEVIRRNPRSRHGLLLRLDQQIRRNEVGEAAVTVAVLSRLLPDAGPLLVNELARMAGEPEVRDSIAGLLSADPRIRTELLEAVARQGADPDAVLSLAGPVQPSAPGETPRWQVLMLDGLVSRNRIARAREVWSTLAGVERTPSGIYDPDFTGLPGPSPFNWRVDASPAGFAEPAPGGGLYAEFYGRDNAVLAQQLLTLSPGGYRISFRGEGNADGQGGRLSWVVACQSNNRAIATVPIVDLSASKTFSATFAVPDGCPAQWLRLSGRFGEFPKDQTMTTTELRIAGAGQS